MTISFAIKLAFEILAILLIIYGVIYEEELCELEKVLWQWIKRGCKKGRGSKNGKV